MLWIRKETRPCGLSCHGDNTNKKDKQKAKETERDNHLRTKITKNEELRYTKGQSGDKNNHSKLKGPSDFRTIAKI